MTARDKGKLLGEKDFRAYYDASQFRTDAWSELKVAVATLARQGPDSPDAADLSQTVANTLELLEGIESYWAFPGDRTVKKLRTALKKGMSQALKLDVDRVARLLDNDDYRRRHRRDIFRELEENYTSGETIDEGDGAAGSEKRPYFELLVVDRLSQEEEDDLRASVLAMRRDDDEFIYDVVVTPSCVDAVIAVLFNHNIQSCVMRYGFDGRSRVKLPELRGYLDQADPELLASLVDDGYVELAKPKLVEKPEQNAEAA
jgi:arginine decarboxylase